MGSTAVLWHRDGAHVQNREDCFIEIVKRYPLNQERIKTTRNYTTATNFYEKKQNFARNSPSGLRTLLFRRVFLFVVLVCVL